MSTHKPYFFIICKDYFYCVPGKDLRTAGDVHSVSVDDQVPFKYNKLSLTGRVHFISNDEDEVWEAIKLEKKALKGKAKREKSFHDDSPRACTQKAKHSGSDMKIKVEKGSKEEKKSLKKEKSLAKKRAQHETELAIISSKEGPSQGLANSMVKAEDSGTTRSNGITEIGSKTSSESEIDKVPGTDGESSASSLEPSKKSDAAKKCDIKTLQGLTEAETSFDGSIHRSSTMITDPPAENAPVDDESLDDTVPVTPNSDDSSKKRSNKFSESEDSSESDKSPIRRKRKFSESDKSSDSSDSSSSVTSSSSEESSSDSTESESDSSDSPPPKKRRKSSKSKKRAHRKDKKSKKSKKDKKKRSRKSKKSSSVKRNLDIFPGPNYKWTEADAGTVRIHPDFPVFILRTDLEDALHSAKSPQTFMKAVVPCVYTQEALKGSTAQGYPSRNVGRKKLKQRDVLPRLDPEGRKAIIKRAEVLENEKKSWRPRIGIRVMNQAFTQIVGSY